MTRPPVSEQRDGLDVIGDRRAVLHGRQREARTSGRSGSVIT